MPTLAGIFVLGQLTGPVADEIHALALRHDPKHAQLRRPHVTLAGSSGVGPIAERTKVGELRRALEPIARTTAPLSLELGAPERFPGTEIVVLPIAPRGAIRELHDRIATSGLHFARPRFAFTPHVTLNLYRALAPARLRELLAYRATGAVVLDRVQCWYTREPQPARLLLELPLGERGAVHASA